MADTRRSFLTVIAGTATLGLAGCSLQAEHDDDIRLENLRSGSVSVDITATSLESGDAVLDRSLTLEPNSVEYIPDPARAGRETSRVLLEVSTADGLRDEQEWEPANVATQLKIYIEPDTLTWDVGPPE